MVSAACLFCRSPVLRLVRFPKREVIHAQHQRRGSRRVGRGADQPQQCRTAHRAGQSAAEPGTGAAAQRERHGLQHLVQVTGAPGIAAGQARHAEISPVVSPFAYSDSTISSVNAGPILDLTHIS